MSRLSTHIVAALVGTLVAGTAAQAEPLGYAPWFDQQSPIFQQAVPDRENADIPG